MPDSLITQLVNGAWDNISKAVSDGLAFGKQKTLSDVVPVLSEKLVTTAWQPPRYMATGESRSYIRQSATAGVIFDYLHRFRLDYYSLQSPDLNAIKTWAASARRFELSHVVGRLAAEATRCQRTTNNLNTVVVDGWGLMRCVTFKMVPDAIPVPDHPASVDWDGPIKIDVESPHPSIQALVFRMGGGPYVRRPADLTLGWLPGIDSVDLVLTEQLELVNVTAKTIAGIQMVRR